MINDSETIYQSLSGKCSILSSSFGRRPRRLTTPVHLCDLPMCHRIQASIFERFDRLSINKAVNVPRNSFGRWLSALLYFFSGRLVLSKISGDDVGPIPAIVFSLRRLVSSAQVRYVLWNSALVSQVDVKHLSILHSMKVFGGLWPDHEVVKLDFRNVFISHAQTCYALTGCLWHLCLLLFRNVHTSSSLSPNIVGGPKPHLLDDLCSSPAATCVSFFFTRFLLLFFSAQGISDTEGEEKIS